MGFYPSVEKNEITEHIGKEVELGNAILSEITQT